MPTENNFLKTRHDLHHVTLWRGLEVTYSASADCEHIKVAYSASGMNGVINLKIFGGLVLNMRGSDCCVDRRGGT